MSDSVDEQLVYCQFHVTKDISSPEALGRGPAKIRGASYLQGPVQVGDDGTFKIVEGTLMVGPLNNSDSTPPVVFGALQYCKSIINHSPYSLVVVGDAVIFDDLDVNMSIMAGGEIKSSRSIKAQGDVSAFCGGHRLSAKKDFDIPHPTKEGWRLTHACVEGPEAAVYVRGRIKNKSQIELPIDCFYHIFAERIDTEKLIPEYEGEIKDYPGDNNQRSIVGYHYDVKE